MRVAWNKVTAVCVGGVCGVCWVCVCVFWGGGRGKGHIVCGKNLSARVRVWRRKLAYLCLSLTDNNM